MTAWSHAGIDERPEVGHRDALRLADFNAAEEGDVTEWAFHFFRSTAFPHLST